MTIEDIEKRTAGEIISKYMVLAETEQTNSKTDQNFKA
jgi:hypothetical protein